MCTFVTLKHVMKTLSISYFRLFLLLCSSLILLFIVAPLLHMFLNTTFPALFDTVKEQEVRSSIGVTLSSALLATLISGCLAIPFSWWLARTQSKVKHFLSAIIDLPIVIPHTAAGIALLGVISRNSLLGGMAGKVGLSFVNNSAGIAIAMAFVSIPFLINAARDGFALIPERLEKAAYNLGASKWRVFFTISVPLAWRSILSGSIMMFARGVSEFGAVVIIAYHPMVAPTLIFDRFNNYGLSYATSASVLVVLLSILFFVSIRLLANKKNDND